MLSFPHQQALLHIDPLGERIKTTMCSYGDDDTGHDGYGASEQYSLPLGPFDVQKALHHKLACICSLMTS